MSEPCKHMFLNGMGDGPGNMRYQCTQCGAVANMAADERERLLAVSWEVYRAEVQARLDVWTREAVSDE